MKDTIHATFYYSCIKMRRKSDSKQFYHLYDGENSVMLAEALTVREHLENMAENEMYHELEIFTTRRGARFIYARDEETDTDYLILFKKGA